jgi:hypothetical protein
MSRYKRMAAIVVISVLALSGALMMMGTALAQQDPYGNGTPPVVSPNVITRPTDQPASNLLRRSPNVQGTPTQTLPFTGADLTLFVATGLGAIATGAVIMHRSREGRARLRGTGERGE